MLWALRFFAAIADAFLWLLLSRRGWFTLLVLALSVGVTPLALLAIPLLWLIPP